MTVDSNRTYIGQVVKNDDPKRLGRVKIKVLDIFDNMKVEDIPWASPWKDLNGNQFNIPDIGKILTVVFESGNINMPEYICSDHYNVNLENKLKDLSNNDYLSMKTIFMDHKTQIYSNDSEGLKLDHKFNLINITDSSINLDLKDNRGKVNLGDKSATQRSILGDHFLSWFDEFVGVLLGEQGGAYIGNLQAPTVASPSLITILQKYKALKEPKFLSKNVNIVDNEYVSKNDRPAEAQRGDAWQSTVEENKLTTIDPNEVKEYAAQEGTTGDTFENKPLEQTNGVIKNVPIITQPSSNPDVDVILELIKMNGYKLYEDINKLNIIAIRYNCLNVGDLYVDTFSDKLYAMYKDNNSNWILKQYLFSTLPGVEFTITDEWLIEKNLTDVSLFSDIKGNKITMKDYYSYIANDGSVGLKILNPAQYVDCYELGEWKYNRALVTRDNSTQFIWTDKDYSNLYEFTPSNYTAPLSGDFNINIGVGFPGGLKVGNWSEGEQVFSNKESMDEFFTLCDSHKELYGNSFTYTLCTKTEWDKALSNVNSNKAPIQ